MGEKTNKITWRLLENIVKIYKNAYENGKE